MINVFVFRINGASHRSGVREGDVILKVNTTCMFYAPPPECRYAYARWNVMCKGLLRNCENKWFIEEEKFNCIKMEKKYLHFEFQCSIFSFLIIKNPFYTPGTKVLMQGKLFQRCSHFLYCSVLSLGGKVNTRRMLQPDIESIFTKIIYELFWS